MIPKAYITEWTQYAPWKSNEQIEQDLIICRVLVELFSDPFLSKELAFRVQLFINYICNRNQDTPKI